MFYRYLHHMAITRNALLAAEIRAEKARQQISGRKLAQAIGKPETTVARYLRGETDMSIDDIEQFAQALNVTTVDLIARAYDSQGPPSGFDGAGQNSQVGDENDTRVIRPNNLCYSGERVIIGPWATRITPGTFRTTAA